MLKGPPFEEICFSIVTSSISKVTSSWQLFKYTPEEEDDDEVPPLL